MPEVSTNRDTDSYTNRQVYLIPGTIMEIIWGVKYGLGGHIDWVLRNQPEVMPTFAKVRHYVHAAPYHHDGQLN